MWCTLRFLADYLDCISRFKSNRVCPYVQVYTGEKNLAPSLFRIFVRKEKQKQKDEVLRNSKKIL